MGGPYIPDDSVALSARIHFDVPLGLNLSYLGAVCYAFFVVIVRERMQAEYDDGVHSKSDPLNWQGVEMATDATVEHVSNAFAQHCRQFWSPFNLEVKQVYCVHVSEDLQERFSEQLGPAVA